MRSAPLTHDPIIRQAEEADIDNLRQLRHEFYRTQIAAGLIDIPSDLTEMLATTTPAMVRGKRQHCLIAEHGGALEGYAAAVVRMVPGMAHSAVGSIEEVFVSAASQRSGTGRRLVTELVGALKRADAVRIQTRVLANNQAAREFWRQAGFFENVHILELGAR